MFDVLETPDEVIDVPDEDDTECGPSDDDLSEFELQYVPHNRIADFERAGWRVVSELRRSHHGVWSVLMRKD